MMEVPGGRREPRRNAKVCELMAVSWPQPEPFGRLVPWALELERLGVTGFGWGAAWLDDAGRVRTYRNPITMADDDEGRDGLADVASTRFLVHLRRPSRLSTTQLADTQPFPAEDGSFAFCHNGAFERHEELRPRFAGRLRGLADTEVGFRLLQDQLSLGLDVPGALREVYRQLGGRANLGYLGSDGELLVYGANTWNPLWQFEFQGASVAATGLHSDDRSLFDRLFDGANHAVRVNDVAVVGSARERREASA
jgi:predicted glutamine amidotransferase